MKGTTVLTAIPTFFWEGTYRFNKTLKRNGFWTLLTFTYNLEEVRGCGKFDISFYFKIPKLQKLSIDSQLSLLMW